MVVHQTDRDPGTPAALAYVSELTSADMKIFGSPCVTGTHADAAVDRKAPRHEKAVGDAVPVGESFVTLSTVVFERNATRSAKAARRSCLRTRGARMGT